MRCDTKHSATSGALVRQRSPDRFGINTHTHFWTFRSCDTRAQEHRYAHAPVNINPERVQTSGKCTVSCQHLLLPPHKLRRLASDEGWLELVDLKAEFCFPSSQRGHATHAKSLHVDMTLLNN